MTVIQSLAVHLGPYSVAGWLIVGASCALAIVTRNRWSWAGSFHARSKASFFLPSAGRYNISQDRWAGGDRIWAEGAPFVRNGTECLVTDVSGRPQKIWAGIVHERLLFLRHRAPLEHLWSFRISRPGWHSIELHNVSSKHEKAAQLYVARAVGLKILGLLLVLVAGFSLIVFHYLS